MQPPTQAQQWIRPDFTISTGFDLGLKETDPAAETQTPPLIFR